MRLRPCSNLAAAAMATACTRSHMLPLAWSLIISSCHPRNNWAKGGQREWTGIYYFTSQRRVLLASVGQQVTMHTCRHAWTFYIIKVNEAAEHECLLVNLVKSRVTFWTHGDGVRRRWSSVCLSHSSTYSWFATANNISQKDKLIWAFPSPGPQTIGWKEGIWFFTLNTAEDAHKLNEI